MEKGRMRVSSINGIKIPDECACMWCGGTMERRGITRVGSGVNTFSLWCQRCGAVVIHARDFNRKIESCDIQFNFEEKV